MQGQETPLVFGDTAQLVKGLPHNHEDLSLIPRAHMEKLGMVVCACALRPGKECAGEARQPIC